VQDSANSYNLVISQIIWPNGSLFMQAADKRQFRADTILRIVALGCLALLLFVAGAEAVHNHANAAGARNSAPCVICVTAHAKAPAITVHLLPELQAVESIAVLPETEGKSAISELQLFIRPPPSPIL
jgi:hypothetical protein